MLKTKRKKNQKKNYNNERYAERNFDGAIIAAYTDEECELIANQRLRRISCNRSFDGHT